ncbi:YceI family protein [Ralstonia pseudosolanacearum]|nr:YceI family protein [Ralstonia pseudosolanacearum]
MTMTHLPARLLAALAVAALPASAFAAWEIEPTHTHISFQVGHLGLTKTPGIFRKFETQLNFDDKDIEAASVTIAIDTASIDTANDLRDAELRGPTWLDAQANPRITFVSTSVRHAEGNHYVISGNLTMRGKTLPVAFQTTLTARTVNPWLQVPAIGFVGSTKIKRSDFGIASFPAAISDEVDLNIALELLKKP